MNKNYVIFDKIRDISPYLKKNYGVISMTVFGSIARGTDNKDSDIDLFVEIPAIGLRFVGLKLFLEETLGKKVDLVRNNKNLDPFLLNEIKRDGIRII